MTFFADDPSDSDPLADLLAETGGDDDQTALDTAVTDGVDEAGADAEEGLGWLDDIVDEMDEADTELDVGLSAEEAELPAVVVAGVTDALKEDSGIDEAEADLEEALAWLDDLDEEDESGLVEEAPSTRITEIEEELSDVIDDVVVDDEPETVVVQPEPDELSLALDRLEQQVLQEGVVVPDTAVFPLMLSADELSLELDWIEQAEAAPAEADDSVVETAVVAEEVAEAAEVVEDEIDLEAMSDDPEAWLEQLLSDDLDMDIEMAPPPIKPSEDAMFVTDDAPADVAESDVVETIETEAESPDSLLADVALDGLPDDPDEAVAWIDELASDEGEGTIAEDMLPDDVAGDEADIVSMEDDPEAWLEDMLSGDLDMDIEMAPPPIKASEDAMFVTDDAAAAADSDTDTDDQLEIVEPEETETAVDPESPEDADETDAASMEDDPEAWLEDMLSGDLDMDIEMAPPPIKASEDAMFVTDDAAAAVEAEAAEESASFEAEAVVESDALEPDSSSDDGTDIIGDVPDDPDEAMAWLEQLAARQGAAIDELPTVTDVEAEPVMPAWMADDIKELETEPDLELADEADLAETAVSDPSTNELAEPDEDIDSEMPDWLDEGEDNVMTGQTDWLRALPEVDDDMGTWLSAEEEATLADPVEEVVLHDTGPLTAQPQPVPQAELDDELFEPVLEPSTGTYNVDEEQLRVAQEAMADGRLDEATDQFKELIASGSGMMTLIAELEQAVDNHPQAPAFSQLLGDAYMRNGQLQKALAAYRGALALM